MVSIICLLFTPWTHHITEQGGHFPRKDDSWARTLIIIYFVLFMYGGTQAAEYSRAPPAGGLSTLD